MDPTDEGETASHDEPTSATVAHGRRKRGSLGPGDHVGRYVVQGTLGMGGMGVVYRARDPELGRAVAIKLVRAGSTASRTRSRSSSARSGTITPTPRCR